MQEPAGFLVSSLSVFLVKARFVRALGVSISAWGVVCTVELGFMGVACVGRRSFCRIGAKIDRSGSKTSLCGTRVGTC